MSNDVLYGEDCELRIGVMADAATLPTAWFNMPFNSLTITPSQTLVQRPRLGAARHNALDGLKSRRGLSRVSADLVIDGDTRTLPRWLRLGLGAPSTTGPASGLYTHLWASGAKAEHYFAVAVRAGTEKVHLLRGSVLGALSTQFGGENVEDFDIQLAIRALSRTREDDWPSGSVTAAPTDAPMLRGQLLIDGAAAAQVPSAGFTFDRNIAEDVYLPTATPATKTASNLRPGPQPTHSGQATVRAHGTAYDDLADAGDTLSAEVRLLGTQTGHMVKLGHPNAELTQPPLQIGSGVIERSFNWQGFQTDDTPACQITVINDVSAYA